MRWWKIWLVPLLTVMGSLSGIMQARERPYFEELDRIEIKNLIAATHFQVTPDGRYVLITIYSNSNAKVGSVNIHRLRLDKGSIDKSPINSILYDGLRNHLTLPSTIDIVDNGKNTPSKAYIYSVAAQEERVGMPLVSGYQINHDGLPTAIENGYAALYDKGYPPFTNLCGSKSIEAENDVMFAITAEGPAVINIKTDGGLSFSGQLLQSPDDGDRQPGLPATLLYVPSSRRLFVGMDCYDLQKPCEENTFLLVYSFSEHNHFNNASLHYVRFDNNNSYPLVMAGLSQSRGIKPVVTVGVMGYCWPSCKTAQTSEVTEGILVVDPVTLHSVMNDLDFPAVSVEFSKSDSRLYVGSVVNGQAEYGLFAYDIASELTVHPVAGSKLRSNLNHFSLELTPDGCHLLATAGVSSDDNSGPGYLILYRINDVELNCTAPPTHTSLTLIISIPATVVGMAGLAAVTILSCYLIKKYGSRKGYSPIND